MHDLQDPAPDQLDMDYDSYVARYVELVRPLPYVEQVYANTSHGLRILTFYRGSLRDFAAELFEAEGKAMDSSPYLPVDFQVIPVNGKEIDRPSALYRQVLAR